MGLGDGVRVEVGVRVTVEVGVRVTIGVEVRVGVAWGSGSPLAPFAPRGEI